MKTVIGIDVGISTTKIVGVCGGKVIAPTRIKATDPVTSLFGAFGKYLYDNHISLADVERVMLTGVGAEYVDQQVYGLPTQKVDEFEADATGAAFGSGLTDMLVVSMGTGTTLIEVRGAAAQSNGMAPQSVRPLQVKHLGGLGIGGGTLSGMAQLMLGTNDVQQVSQMAEKGNIAKINLSIGDISARPLPGLPMDATASLFGNVDNLATPEDISIGLLWTVMQTIGSATVLASKSSGLTDFVMIGNLTQLPQARQVFDSLEPLYKVRFIIPPYADFCTAIGAAMKE